MEVAGARVFTAQRPTAEGGRSRGRVRSLAALTVMGRPSAEGGSWSVISEGIGPKEFSGHLL